MASRFAITWRFHVYPGDPVLSGISAICFGASYSIALVLEVARLLTQSSWRQFATWAIMVAGFFAHTVFLVLQLRERYVATQPMINWYSGCLTLAWVFAANFVLISAVRKKSSAGFVLLPTAVTMIVVAHVFPTTPRALQRWNMLHGLSLAFGMALVVIGCIAGLMYLWQSNRLKQKKLPSQRLWLPSLERLQRTNERCLIASVVFLGIGLLSGVLLNLVRHQGEEQGVPWSDPIVIASGVWLLWLFSILIFHSFYRPARQGRKTAYMTIGSFLFLGIILAIVRWIPSTHNSGDGETARRPILRAVTDLPPTWRSV